MNGGARMPPRRPRPQPPELAESPLVTTLREAVRRGETQAVPRFWSEIADRGTPLIEPSPGEGGQRIVTFLWRADTPRAVLLLANCLTDRSVLPESLLQRIPGTDVWYRGYRLGADWTGSYQFAEFDHLLEEIDRHGWRAAMSRAAVDPFNDTVLPTRWDEGPRSIAELPLAPEPVWIAADAPSGRTELHYVPGHETGGDRRVWVHHSPSRPGVDHAVAVLLDGDIWSDVLPVASTVDTLVHNGTLPPVTLLMPDAVDRETRWRELGCDPGFHRFLTTELLPWARGRWPLTEDPGRTVIAGQSLGGLTAVHAGLLAPEVFGAVLSQSGSFWWHPDGADPGWLLARMAERTASPVRVRLEVGTQEWILRPWQEPAARALRTAGHHVTTAETNGGHDYAWWSRTLPTGLADLLAES